MGNDSEKKEDSGFGFKDKAKAIETIKLLENEPSSYQSLTVRGLLGRAKRTLKLTKDTGKIKNISEAIEVFEKWVEDKKKSAGSDDKKKSSTKKERKKSSDGEEAQESESKSKDDNSSDTVPGLGFKDKVKALETIKLLEGRDPDYQKLAVKGLIGRAKRVLTCTKDKDKLQNIKDAVNVFEKFLEKFDKMNLSKENMSYLPLSVIESCMCLVEHYNISTPRVKDFLGAYKSVDGQYKKLRTVEDKESKLTWDIVRNKELKSLRKKYEDIDLFEDDGNPTKDHLKLVLWAFSPQEQRMKKIKIIPIDSDVNMKDVTSSNGSKNDNVEENKDRKRKRKNSSGDPNDSSAAKKRLNDFVDQL